MFEPGLGLRSSAELEPATCSLVACRRKFKHSKIYIYMKVYVRVRVCVYMYSF